MNTYKTIHVNSNRELFEQLHADFAAEPNLLDYQVLVKQGGHSTVIDIDIDLGGGFEGGYESTTLSAPLHTPPGFQFSIHHEGALAGIGKLLGFQDVISGYEVFDKNVIIKTDNEDKVKTLFASQEVRSVFGDLLDFKLHTARKESTDYLELEIEKGILDAAELTKLYSAFYKVLLIIDYIE